jgi:hypothetical protein
MLNFASRKRVCTTDIRTESALQDLIELHIIKGLVTQRGTPIYRDTGTAHEYLTHNGLNNNVMRCRHRCGASGVMETIEEQNNFFLHLTKFHTESCPNEFKSVQEGNNADSAAILRRKIIQNYGRYEGSLKQICEKNQHDLALKGYWDVAAGINATGLKSAGSRHRKQQMPKASDKAYELQIPEELSYIRYEEPSSNTICYILSNNRTSLDISPESINKVKFLQLFKSWESDGKIKTVMIFCSEATFKEMWNKAIYMLSDGTFSIVPRQFMQLYTVQYLLEDDGKLLPCLWILTTNKDEETYDVVVNWMVEKARELKLGDMPCKSISVDYEQAWINSWKRAFPSAKVEGCYFHLCQAILRYMIKECGLRSSYFNGCMQFKTYMRMLLSVPFLPPQDMLEGFEMVKKLIEDDARTNGHYYDKVCFGIQGTMICVHKRSMRTNNLIEGFHGGLQSALEHQPDFYRFVKYMQPQEVVGVRLNSYRTTTLHGESAARNISNGQKCKDEAINNITKRYEDKSITIQQFLQGIANERKQYIKCQVSDK